LLALLLLSHVVGKLLFPGILSLGVKTSARCSANKLAFSLLLLVHGPGVGDCFLIGRLAGNGLEVDLIGRHIELSCRLRFVT
jgi:hypothetical protein